MDTEFYKEGFKFSQLQDDYDDLNKNKDNFTTHNNSYEQSKHDPQFFKRKLTLDNFVEWKESLISQINEKVQLLYFMPLNLAYDTLKSKSIDSFPLGEFVLANSGYKLNNKDSYREALFKILPSLRQKTDAPLLYENFSHIFDSSLKDDINFELQFYFQFSMLDQEKEI